MYLGVLTKKICFYKYSTKSCFDITNLKMFLDKKIYSAFLIFFLFFLNKKNTNQNYFKKQMESENFISNIKYNKFWERKQAVDFYSK